MRRARESVGGKDCVCDGEVCDEIFVSACGYSFALG
jgi:hypothetical protein